MIDLERELQHLPGEAAGPAPRTFLQAVRSRRRRRRAAAAASASLFLLVGFAAIQSWKTLPPMRSAPPLAHRSTEPRWPKDPAADPMRPLSVLWLSRAGVDDLPAAEIAASPVPTAMMRPLELASLLR